MKNLWEGFKRGLALFVAAQMFLATLPTRAVYAADYFVDQNPENQPVLITTEDATIRGSFATGGCMQEVFTAKIHNKTYGVNVTNTYANPNGGNGCFRQWNIVLDNNIPQGTYSFSIKYSGNLTADYLNAFIIEDKIRVCHVNSGEKEYNNLNLPISAFQSQGHPEHVDDIIPPGYQGIDSKNWDEGEGIWSNDCKGSIRNEYTVTFDANGGTPTPDPQTVEEGEEVDEPEEPTREGYEFEGWFGRDSLEPWDFSQDEVASDLTLVAHWKDIDFDDDGKNDNEDNCPFVYNPHQENTFGDDNIGDACGDVDGDEIMDEFDNCPVNANYSQADTDGDKVGDACDDNDDEGDDPRIELIGPDNITKEYGDPYEEPGATCYFSEEDTIGTPADFDEDLVTWQTPAREVPYEIIYTCPYADITASRLVTVVPRVITIKANPASKFVGDADPVLSFEVIGSLLDGDLVAGKLTRKSGETVGVYDIEGKELSLGPNYKITFIPAVFTVKEKPSVTTFSTVDTTTPTPVTTDVPVATTAAVAGTASAATTEEAPAAEEKEVKGEEKSSSEKDEKEECPWWWIISLVLAALLVVNYLLAKKYKDNKNVRNVLLYTPPILGVGALIAHAVIAEGLAHTIFCTYLWLIAALEAGAYYLIKGRMDKKEGK